MALCCAGAVGAAEAKNAYFGDLHVHTRYSFDAFLFGTATSPDDAYRYAKGETIPHAAGFDLRIDSPLDFYAVTDHAFYLGMFWAWAQPDHPDAANPDVRKCAHANTVDERAYAFRNCFDTLGEHGRREDSLTAWRDIQAAAERHNDPGTFTTFVGYEYTSSNPGNLHRNVFFRGSEAPVLPFSRLDSLNPEDLWAWMDVQRAAGMDAIAIPHNPNGSDGGMFDSATFEGEPLSAAYADLRMRNEPLVEITQVKGTSDTHPFLSPDDEWADFEIFPFQVASWSKSRPRGSYVREAWMNGLAMEASDGLQPLPLRHRRRPATPTTPASASARTSSSARSASSTAAQPTCAARCRSRKTAFARPTSATGAHPASPAHGRRRTPARPSSRPSAARRRSPPAARASRCASWPATSTTTSPTPRIC